MYTAWENRHLLIRIGSQPFHFDKSYNQRALQSSTTDDALFTKPVQFDCKQALQFGSLRRIRSLVHNREGRVTPHLIVDYTPVPICLLRRIVQVLGAIQHGPDVPVALLRLPS